MVWRMREGAKIKDTFAQICSEWLSEFTLTRPLKFPCPVSITSFPTLTFGTQTRMQQLPPEQQQQQLQRFYRQELKELASVGSSSSSIPFSFPHSHRMKTVNC